jgi:hypothetical protein
MTRPRGQPRKANQRPHVHKTMRGLANTYFWIDPTVKIGGLMMTQVIPFADPAILKAYRAFERTVYEELASWDKTILRRLRLA